MILNKEKIAPHLQVLGNAWVSLVLIIIALFLLYLAFFNRNIALKAFVATWVLAP